MEGPAVKTKDLHYELPAERIAQRPCVPRDAARLMVLHRATGRLEHRAFRDLPEYLTPRDCLVINRTYVVPAKFVARRASGGKIGGLFVREDAPGQWTVLLAGAGRLRPGEELALERQDWRMRFVRRRERGMCEVRVEPPAPASLVLEAIGDAPLPPYIRRTGEDEPELRAADRSCYQTVYAKEAGAIAAPTAGMHFTPELLHHIRHDLGATIADVVLHVGLGTFQPVEVEDLTDHKMHEEWYCLSPENAAAIEQARASGGRVIAVGTTSVRVLETCAATGRLLPQSGWTNLLIQPPCEFRAVDALVTNFHLPGSTLLALVFAFAGRERILAAYQTAIEQEYRFYSFGDAMLIL